MRQEPQAEQQAHLARQQAQAGQLLAPLGCRQRARQQLEQLLKQMLLRDKRQGMRSGMSVSRGGWRRGNLPQHTTQGWADIHEF